VAFSSSTGSAAESATPALIPVTLSTASGLTVTVNYSVTGGTATGSGTDYTLAAGTLTFNAGVTSQNISVALVDDRVEEVAGETVIITLAGPTNATLGGTTVNTFTIQDDPSGRAWPSSGARPPPTAPTSPGHGLCHELDLWEFDSAVFSHSNSVNPSRLTVLAAGDYFWP